MRGTDAMPKYTFQRNRKTCDSTLVKSRRWFRLCEVHQRMLAKSLQLRLTLSNPMDYSLLGSSVHGILLARMGCRALLQWIFPTQDHTCISQISCLGRQTLYHLAPPGKIETHQMQN